MTYIVSSGALNSTHSLTRLRRKRRQHRTINECHYTFRSVVLFDRHTR